MSYTHGHGLVVPHRFAGVSTATAIDIPIWGPAAGTGQVLDVFINAVGGDVAGDLLITAGKTPGSNEYLNWQVTDSAKAPPRVISDGETINKDHLWYSALRDPDDNSMHDWNFENDGQYAGEVIHIRISGGVGNANILLLENWI